MGCLRYGPVQEGINEIIATTRNNAAPIGIICRDGHLSVAVFKTSHTAQNLLAENWIVANISQDPVLFVRTAFGDLPEEMFKTEIIGDLRVQRLADAGTWIAYRTEIITSTDLKILVSLIPVKEVMEPVLPRAVNRGLCNIIEASVHGTRYLLSNLKVFPGYLA